MIPTFKPRTPPKTPITVNLDDDLIDKIERVSAEHNTSRSEAHRVLLALGLERLRETESDVL